MNGYHHTQSIHSMIDARLDNNRRGHKARAKALRDADTRQRKAKEKKERKLIVCQYRSIW